MRNEFLRYLATVVQEGKLKAPFDVSPPKGSIKQLARTLVRKKKLTRFICR